MKVLLANDPTMIDTPGVLASRSTRIAEALISEIERKRNETSC